MKSCLKLSKYTNLKGKTLKSAENIDAYDSFDHLLHTFLADPLPTGGVTMSCNQG